MGALHSLGANAVLAIAYGICRGYKRIWVEEQDIKSGYGSD